MTLHPKLVRRLLDVPGAKWALLIFFRDNRLTAMVVALKMAMHTGHVDAAHRIHLSAKIIRIQCSSHDYNLGVMNCRGESSFDELQTPLYEAHGP